MRLRIGVDLDGVVYDFVAAFRRHLVSVGHAPDELPEPEQWEMWEAWGLSQSTWFEHFAAGIACGEIFGSGDPYPGAVAALSDLHARGHSIHIVTARGVHPAAVGLTSHWLAEHRIPYSTLTFAADKTVIPCDIFIEDSVDNARALGSAAVLMDRPWNRDAPGIERVPSWDGFLRAVELRTCEKSEGRQRRLASVRGTRWVKSAVRPRKKLRKIQE